MLPSETDQLSLVTSDTKRNLLLLVKRCGAVSLTDAEKETGLSRTTIREHFVQMERDELVKRFTRRQGRGRPELRYRLSAEGERLFPTRDNVLLASLLSFLQQEGRDDLIRRFLKTSGRNVFRTYTEDCRAPA